MKISLTEYYREYRRKKDGKPDYIEADMEKCLICSKMYVFLGGHVRQTHKMLMQEYKAEFGLDTKRGRTRGQFRELKAKRVRETGTINNLKKGAKYRYKKGDKIGSYARSRETIKRLAKQAHKMGNLYGGKNI